MRYHLNVHLLPTSHLDGHLVAYGSAGAVLKDAEWLYGGDPTSSRLGTHALMTDSKPSALLFHEAAVTIQIRAKLALCRSCRGDGGGGLTLAHKRRASSGCLHLTGFRSDSLPGFRAWCAALGVPISVLQGRPTLIVIRC